MFSTNHNILLKATILALCVISFVHIFVFPIYNINAGRNISKTYMDLEQYLCEDNVKYKKIWKKAHCPQYGIVTIFEGGRLGNLMWEYASVWATARRTGLEPYIPRCIRLKMDQIFDSLTIPTFEEVAHCSLELNKFVKSLDKWNYTNQSIILPRFSVLADLVITWVQDIVQEFSIKKKYLNKAQKILQLASKNCTDCIFVGVHVRRTDFLLHIKNKYSVEPANVSFFESAMDYFENKYTKVMFIITSDDPGWCKKNFSHKKNVYVTRTSPALDLTILASCNHTIFDYGTYGQWAALLAGGETIYYNLTHHYSSETIGQLLSNWRTI